MNQQLIFDIAQIAAAGVTAFATLVLCWVTAVLAKETKAMADRTSEPHVVVTLEPNRWAIHFFDMHIMNAGNEQVILCERGIRTYETMTRNTFDVGAIHMLRHLSHLPVVGDPSHGIGIWHGVNALARSAVAAGAHGLIVEVHPRPEDALSDGPQSLRPERFRKLMRELDVLRNALAEVGAFSD